MRFLILILALLFILMIFLQECIAPIRISCDPVDGNSNDINPDLLWQPGALNYRNQLAYDSYLNGRKIFFKDTNFEPWPVPKQPLWDENPFNNVTWEFNYHSLTWLHAPAYIYDLTRNPKYLDEIIRYIFSWIEKNPKSNPASTMAWYDHSVAYRAATFTYLYHKYLKSRISPAKTKILFSSLKEHGRELKRLINDPFWYGNNHSMHHSLSLYCLSVAFPEITESPSWKLEARNRIITLMKEMVNVAEGVSIEQSMAYHYVALGLFSEANKLLRNFLDALPEGEMNIMGKMVEFAATARWPDGSLPSYGDTNYEANYGPSILNKYDEIGLSTDYAGFILSQGKKGKHPPDAHFYPNTGYAIFRPSYGDAGSWKDDLSLVVDMGLSIKYHGHNDALNFMLYAYGTGLIIDPGGPYIYDWTGNDKFRNYFISSQAHNTIIVDEKNYSPAVTVIKRNFDQPNYSFVEAEHYGYPGITHKRSILLLKPDLIIIIDNLVSNSEQIHKFDLLYHFPPETITQTTRNGLTTWSNNLGGLSISVEPYSSIKLSIIKGQEQPFVQGWVTPGYAIKVPAPVAQFRQEAKKCWFITTIKLSSTHNSLSISSKAKFRAEEWGISVKDDFKVWSIYLPRAGNPLISIRID